MSQTFTQLTNLIDRNCQTTATSYPIADKTADCNLALDSFLAIALQADGKWQVDDSNQTKYPILTADLVSGQRDYSFTTDEQGNIILEIYKVMVKNPSGLFVEMAQVDQQSENSPDNPITGMVDGQNLTGIPNKYDKTGNGLFLDPIPNYDSTGGLKLWINREASYFTVSDTTKKPGFAGIFHEYIALRPSYMYAMRKGLKNVRELQILVLQMEAQIKKHFSQRAKDEQWRITPESVNAI